MALETSDDIASELRRYFREMQVKLETKRKALGVADELKDVPGIIAPMLLALGRNNIRTVEDLAACATDDLFGWNERRGRREKRHRGILEGLALSREECDILILKARAQLGWIDDAT
jgi:N utilization substance protein A